MRINCEIDNIKTLKKGMKITLAIGDKEVPRVMKNIYNFMDKPITIDFLIDEKKQIERMKQITPEQRKKIYAIFRDIENYTGETLEDVKEKTKQSFIKISEYDDFSLSNCSKELATDFIEYLIRLCFRMGVPLKDNPADGFEDIERYLALCLEEKRCAVCGAEAEIHHWDAIGIGIDRTSYDDSKHRKIALCREHHQMAHRIGRESFKEKYHVYGIIYQD